MLILSNYRQISRIVKHVSQSFSSQKSSTNQRRNFRIPKGITCLFYSGNVSSLKVLLRHIFEIIVPIRKCITIPPITVTYLSIHNFNSYNPLSELVFLLIVILVSKHHLHTHRDVSFKLLGNEIELYTFW